MKFNHLGIFQTLKLRKLMRKILRISLKTKFYSKTSGYYGLTTATEMIPNAKKIISWHSWDKSIVLQDFFSLATRIFFLRQENIFMPRKKKLSRQEKNNVYSSRNCFLDVRKKNLWVTDF